MRASTIDQMTGRLIVALGGLKQHITDTPSGCRLTPFLAFIAISMSVVTGQVFADDTGAVSTTMFNLEIKGGRLVQTDRIIRVHAGDIVRINWTADTALAVHLHGYDIKEQLTPGIEKLMTFEAYATGRFPVNVHQANSENRSHHGQDALLYLEVLPD